MQSPKSLVYKSEPDQRMQRFVYKQPTLIWSLLWPLSCILKRKTQTVLVPNTKFWQNPIILLCMHFSHIEMTFKPHTRARSHPFSLSASSAFIWNILIRRPEIWKICQFVNVKKQKKKTQSNQHKNQKKKTPNLSNHSSSVHLQHAIPASLATPLPSLKLNDKASSYATLVQHNWAGKPQTKKHKKNKYPQRWVWQHWCPKGARTQEGLSRVSLQPYIMPCSQNRWESDEHLTYAVISFFFPLTYIYLFLIICFNTE